MKFTTDYDKNYADALEIVKGYMPLADDYNGKGKNYRDDMLNRYREIRDKAEDERNMYLDHLDSLDKPLDERYTQYDSKYQAADEYENNLDDLFYELNKVHEILQNLAYCAMEYADNNNKLGRGA